MGLERANDRHHAEVLTTHDALTHLLAVEQQERQRGRFDVEGDEFQRLRDALLSGSLTPKDVVTQADKLANERQDYN